RNSTGFENMPMGANGTLDLGAPPTQAFVEGGTTKQTRLANSGDWAWTIDEGQVGTITFSTPVTELVLWFTNELEAALIIPDDDAGDPNDPPVQAVCGVQNVPVGLDNGEAFGTPLFARGGFNDWGNSGDGLAPRFQFYNYGEGVYNAQFEIETPDTYEFKIADGGWTVEYGNPDVDFVLDVPVTMSGGAALGGANSNLVVDMPGCYNFEMTIVDDSAFPAPVADLLLSLVEIDPGDAVLARSELRIYDENDELIATFDGLDEYQRIELIRTVSETPIRRIEIESFAGDEGTTGIGEIAVDDLRFGVAPDETPRPVEIFYSRPGGDYSNTKIVVTTNGVTQELDCIPNAGFGCSVTVDALLGYDVTYEVINDGVPDQGGEITFAVADASDNAAYTFEGSNVPVLRDLPAVPQGDNEVILYYFRPDGEYEGWGLHLFPQDGSPAWTMFTGGEYPPAGIDDVLGAYFIIGLPGSDRLTEPYSGNPAPTEAFPESLGLIIHRGDEKDPGPDQFINIAEDGNVIFVTSGVVPVATTPPIPGAVSVIGAAAHWVSPTTLLWDAGDNVASVELFHSNAGTITTAGTGLVGQDGQFALTDGVNPLPDNAGNQAHLAELAAYTLPPEASQIAKDLVKDQLIAVGFDIDGQRVAATAVQTPLVIDALYADEAEDAELGVVYDGGAPTLNVWAPTANSVAVNLYDDPARDTPAETADMTYDDVTGVWSVTGPSTWDRRYYTYAVNVYSPSAALVVDNVVTDPYSVSLSTGSASGRLAKSQIVNLDDTDLAPAGWTTLQKPALEAPEDIVLYELHIRDFSVLDDSVPEADRGKYNAFTGTGSGMMHLSDLADAGLTHVHLLPTFDIATVNEDATQRVDITDTVEDLCAANAAAQSLCDDFAGMRIIDVMAAQPGDSPLPQQINEWIKDLDGFNWGYDPFHFGVPEGSYASDPEGVARIGEFRNMVKGLSDIGLRTVMDVVYNHTNAAGNVSDRSVLDRVVPGYYHRQSEFTGIVLQDSCCPDTAS
ncbi:MAG: pullulanase-associated domain-containing protein, partial [Pseudomonadota bacterium]